MWQYGITEETHLCQYWSYYILYPLLLCSLESLILFMGWNSSWLYFITRLHLQCKCSLKWEILCTVSGNVININNILHLKLSSQQRCCFHSGTLWRKWIASLPPKIMYSLFIIFAVFWFTVHTVKSTKTPKRLWKHILRFIVSEWHAPHPPPPSPPFDHQVTASYWQWM